LHVGRRLLVALGKAAAVARSARLGNAVAWGRDSLDVLLIRRRTPPLKVTAEGLCIHGFLRHRSFLAGVAEGDYEPFYRFLFLDALVPGLTVVDGGAHVGLYTLLAARAVGPSGSVLAFEPDPYNFAALACNVEAARLHNVRLIPKALSRLIRREAFQKSMGTISSSLLDRRDSGPFRRTEVEATTLDYELAGSHLSELLVKLDVEGAEPLALEGMRETIVRTPTVTLFVEINPSALGYLGYSAEKLVDDLLELGLTVLFIDDRRGELIRVPLGASLPKGNLLCRKVS
jgi:FkbM family methyltransferase